MAVGLAKVASQTGFLHRLASRSNGHGGSTTPKAWKRHGRPHLQCAHRLASLCRYAGVQHAARNPCFAPRPSLASGRGSRNESLCDFHVNATWNLWERIAI